MISDYNNYATKEKENRDAARIIELERLVKYAIRIMDDYDPGCADNLRGWLRATKDDWGGNFRTRLRITPA